MSSVHEFDPSVIGAEAGNEALVLIADRARQDLDSLRRDLLNLSPERVAANQEASLRRMGGHGLVEVFKAIARRVEETDPLVEVRQSSPTGDPTDAMVIGLFFDFKRGVAEDGGSTILYRQIYAVEPYSDNRMRGYVIGKGERVRHRNDSPHLQGERFPAEHPLHDGKSNPSRFDYDNPGSLRASAQLIALLAADPFGLRFDATVVQRPPILIPHAESPSAQAPTVSAQ